MPPLGSASRKWISRGTLLAARRSRQCARSSLAVAVVSGLRTTTATGHLAALVVGRRDDGALEDARVRAERDLDLDRRDVLAGADDDVLRPVLDQDVAGLVDRRHVAGVQPAVADRRVGRLGVAVVAVHHGVAADDDLADLLAVGPDVAALGVDDPDADAGDRPAGHRLALLAALRRLRSSVRTARGWARVTIGDVSVSP